MRLGKSAKNMLLILSTAAISSCVGLSAPEFPADYYYELDFNNHFCGRWKIINKKEMVAEFYEDLPLAECNGVIGFRKEDSPKVIHWIKKVKRSE